MICLRLNLSSKTFVFDTDCLFTFFYVKCENVLLNLLNKIVIPLQVYKEISRMGFKDKIDYLINKQKATRYVFDISSEEAFLYLEMTNETEMEKIKVIGFGEAACIAYAKVNNAILCSNNLKDITFYIDKYKLKYLTTADIFCMLRDNKLMDDLEIEKCWAKMKSKVFLPNETFYDYYNENKDLYIIRLFNI